MRFKTFMIYNEYYPKSKKNMMDSIQTYNSAWQIEGYDGCAPNNLKDFEKEYPLPNTDRHKRYVNNKKNISKKCCFYSHFSLWNYCAKNLDYIVIVENDVEAELEYPLNLINEFANLKNDCFGIQLTTESACLNTKGNKKHHTKYTEYDSGIHEVYHKVNKTGKRYFIGATGYILNNQACGYLIKNCEKYGWTQNDLLFNADDDFDLYFIKPSIARYNKEKENKTSSNFL